MHLNAAVAGESDQQKSSPSYGAEPARSVAVSEVQQQAQRSKLGVEQRHTRTVILADDQQLP